MNALTERRGRLREAQASRFLDLLAQLPIDTDDSATDPARIVSAGRQHGLSSYDTSYLILAERLGAPLATLGRRLADAATRAGVPLLIEP